MRPSDVRPSQLKPSDCAAALIFAAGLFAAVLAGCDDGFPARSAVWGEVTVDGDPLPAGTITFTPTAGGPRASGRIVGGQYDLAAAAGPPVGPCRVAIVAADPDGPAPGEELSPTELAALAANPPPPVAPLPAVYNTASTLERAVAPGPNHFDFDLTRDPKATP